MDAAFCHPKNNLEVFSMQENRHSNCTSGFSSRDVCCIEADKIYDSCRDRDCFENVRVNLSEFGYEIIGRTGNIRAKDAYIAWTYIGLDRVRFNRGFYTVNIRYYIKINFEACIGANKPQEFEGIATVDKKVVLFGGEKNVNVFRSETDECSLCQPPEATDCSYRAPIAVVEATDPIILDSKVFDKMSLPVNCCCACCDIPDKVLTQLESPINTDRRECDRFLTVSLGIFSIIRLTRPTQLLVNATEYCIPDKECIAPRQEDPCAIFNSMAFPSSEFCSPAPQQITGSSCKCN